MERTKPFFSQGSTRPYDPVGVAREEEPLPHTPPQRPGVTTDEQAHSFLPPYPMVRKLYTDFRQRGLEPEEALQATLDDWRAFWHEGAPRNFSVVKDPPLS